MKSSVYVRGLGGVRANVTPLIDVVFLLMIFFMLVAQIQRAEKVRLELPALESELAREAGGDGVVVINVEPGGLGYRVGARSYGADEGGLVRLEGEVRAFVERGAALGEAAGVSVRADRREGYGAVEPLLGVLSRAGVARVDLVVGGEAGVEGGGGG